MQTYAGEVNTVNRKEIPSPNETICDDMDIEAASKFFTRVLIYFRDKEACPFNRGNWIIDFFTDNRIIPTFCMKLPASMTEGEIRRWVKPLVDKLNIKGN